MRVLFVDAADCYLGRRRTPFKPAPLIGMAYIATCAQSQGHDVRMYDFVIGEKTGAEINRVLTEFMPHVVALTSTTPFIPDNYRFAKTVHQISPSTIVVLGGPHASVLPGRCLEECPDLNYVVVGEGEFSFLDLLRSFSTGMEDKNIPGILQRGQSLADLKMRPLIDDLDALPFPNWLLYNYSDYDRVYSERLGRWENLYQILFSRGCPYQCSFCYNIFGPSYRLRSTRNILEEIRSAYTVFGAHCFDFVDPTMTLCRERFLEFCKGLYGSPFTGEIAWNFETRADLVDTELLKYAKKAGCESILFGIESGSHIILDAMGKGIIVDHVWKAIDMAVTANLRVKATLIVGSPFETRETLEETLAFVEKAKAKYDVDFMPSFLGVYPGTRMFDMIERGEGRARWTEGVRYNWRRARRDRPMIEVGDLDTTALLDFMKELVSVISKQA